MSDFSMSGAGSGAASGAQLGSNFGPWGAIIGGAVGFVGGGIEGAAIEKWDKKTLKIQNDMIRQQEEARNQRNTLLLKEMARASVENQKELNYAYQNTSRAVRYIEREAGTSTANINVQLASAGAIGNTARHIYSSVDAERDAALSNQWLALETAKDNSSTSLYSMLNQAVSMTDTSAYTPLLSPSKAGANQAALLGIAETGASMYSQGMFDGISDFFKKDDIGASVGLMNNQAVA